MPDVDDIELLRHVRSDSRLSQMPVVSEFAQLSHCQHCQQTQSACCQHICTVPPPIESNGAVSGCMDLAAGHSGHILSAAVMSANETNDTVFECIQGGAEDYLLKPLTRKEVQMIWQHVWRRQQQAKLPQVRPGPAGAPPEGDVAAERPSSQPASQEVRACSVLPLWPEGASELH